MIDEEIKESEEEEVKLLNHKLYLSVETGIDCDDNKYYSIHSDFGTSGSGCGLRSAEDVIACIKRILAHPSNMQGEHVKLTPDRVVLENTTSIHINVPALIAQLSGNSLMGFLETNVHAGRALADEPVTKKQLEDHARMTAEDKFDYEVLDPLRDKIRFLEREALKFGLPERTGWSVWNGREKQAALKKYPQAKSVFDALDKIKTEFEKAYCTRFGLEMTEEDVVCLNGSS